MKHAAPLLLPVPCGDVMEPQPSHRTRILARAKQAMCAQGGAAGWADNACRPNLIPVARGVMRALSCSLLTYGRGFGLARFFRGAWHGK